MKEHSRSGSYNKFAFTSQAKPEIRSEYSAQDFRDFAVKHRGISGSTFDDYVKVVDPITNLTPNIIEERRMNAVVMDVYSRLMMDRIIFLGYPIDDQVANIVVAQLLYLESLDSKKDVLIYINSPGGSVYAGLGVYDTMQYIKPDVVTICTGLAASMAAVLLAGGTKEKRSALKHARIMIHQPFGGAGGQASDVEISAQQILSVRKELYDILAQHSGKTYEDIDRDSDRDHWLSAQEAQEYGLIDEVLSR